MSKNNVYAIDTQFTQIGEGETSGRQYKSMFYDAAKKVVFIRSLSERKHSTVYTSTSKGIDTLYTIAGRDPVDIGRIFLLLENMDGNNMIMKLNHKTQRAVPATSKQDLQDIVGYKSRTAASKFFKLLEDKSVIAELTITIKNEKTGKEERKKRFYLNPVYTMPRKGISLDTYNLFKESIDQLLTNDMVREIEKIIYKDMHGEDMPVTPPIIVRAADETFISDIIDVADYDAIFEKLILKNEKPRTYQKIGKGMIAHQMTTDNDTYFLPNQTADYKATKPAKADITGFHAWYLDIDAGKDENKHYFPIEEVAKRKAKMFEVINALPAPTAVIDTRNGYHIYFACSAGVTETEWEEVEAKLNSVAKIADPSAAESSRLLRLPNSKWIKASEGLPAYDVTIIGANDISYSALTLADALDKAQDKAAAAAAEYLELYPAAESKAAYATVASRATEEQTVRVQAIIDLSDATFAVPDEKTVVADARQYLKMVNLADFLQVMNPKSFCCIMHDDHNPSASIYQNQNEYKYYCASPACAGNGDGKGADIFDIVQTLAGCTFQQAKNYLCRIYGIRQQSAA